MSFILFSRQIAVVCGLLHIWELIVFSQDSRQVVGYYDFTGDYYLHSNPKGDTWVVSDEGIFIIILIIKSLSISKYRDSCREYGSACFCHG